MASINDIPYKVIQHNPNEETRKVPIPLTSEGFFFHNERMKFTVKTSSRHHATKLPGFVYLTNKRLVLIAKEPKDSFESFQIIFEEVMSLKANRTVKSTLSSYVCHTVHEHGIQVELDFHDAAQCQTYNDYMKMIVVTAAAQNLAPAETELMEATRIEYVELPPSYSTVAAGVSDPILEENPIHPSRSQSIPSYSATQSLI
ncbi:hypothetical protein K450DRAFT_253196 [Umbelopsis ramanniana AG]|uniref:Uncharacterized protein n=1 Tax=Umbelopsis ramanniana AG TaxID=1314678 RepID=A0AAD5HAP9_UMBRA|nr:uncharacterized protein K450DRAFT_253196 [Umbelopsis ramanniana AG]KAI8577172.1 hypothetical protein K450DRAFT_253196 [Umbelopsis ramanniana AG]